MAKANNNWIASKAEHHTYNLFWLGQNLLWGFAGYVATYLTDLGIDAALAATILIAPKIWDAVNDTIFGYIVDRFTFKNGDKFMPWVKLGTAGIGIITVFMFCIPFGLSNVWKIIWFIAAYLVFDCLYTFLDAPAFAMATVMTDNIQERTSFISGNKLWAMVGGVLSVALIGTIRTAVGGWAMASIVFCGGGCLMMVPFLFFGKERRSMEESEKEEKFTFKQMFNYLKSNKYLLICLIAFFVFGMTAIESTMSIYLARLCMGGEGNSLYIAAAVAVPVIVISAIVPPIAKKIDKFYIMIIGILFSIVVGIVSLFVGYNNLVVSLIMVGLKCVGLAIWQIIIYMLVADTTEYGTYKSGTRATGITFSLQTFVSKLKGAFVSSFVLFCLAAIGFVSGEDAIQPDGMADKVWAMFVIIPVIGYIVGMGLLIAFYKLRDDTVQVMAKYNNNEISYDECMKLIGDKFGEPAIKKEIISQKE